MPVFVVVIRDRHQYWCHRYTHDGWDRLVKVEFVDDIDGSPTASTVGEYACNGLNWRIMGRADTDLDNDLDQQRMMDSPAAPGIWQLLRRKTGQVQVQEIGDCPEFPEFRIGDCREFRISERRIILRLSS